MIDHDGFKRISSNIYNHSREFIFTEDSVSIADNIEGKNKIDLEMYFQISKNSDYKITLDTNLENDHQEFEGSTNPMGGWKFYSFGEKDIAITKKISKNITLPFKSCSKIELLN